MFKRFFLVVFVFFAFIVVVSAEMFECDLLAEEFRKPFSGNPYIDADHFDFVPSIDLSRLSNLRFHGKYGTDVGFSRAPHPQLSDDDYPQDAVAAFLQRLFPSPVMGEFTANNLENDRVRKWLVPGNVAQLMQFIGRENYCEMSPAERLRGIVAAISENYKNLLKRDQRKKGKNFDEGIFFESFQKKNVKVCAFAELLDAALMTSRDKNHENYAFYGPRIVEDIIFGYMCARADGVQGVEGYYRELDCLVPDTTLRMTEKSYRALKAKVISGIMPLETFMTAPEMMLQLHYGYQLYDSVLPQVTGYTTAIYVDENSHRHGFSNCVEATLLDFFAALQFDPVKHRFDPNCLVRFHLDDAFRHLNADLLRNPASIVSQKVADRFAGITANLNGRTQDVIRYRKGIEEEGENIYEIDPGLDNFLRVMGVLLGDDDWQIMQGDHAQKIVAVTYNLNRICTLFSREGVTLTWENQGTADHTLDNASDVNILFNYNGKPWFVLDFMSSHASFVPVFSEAQQEMSTIGERILCKSVPWQPYFAFFIQSFEAIFEHIQDSERFASYLKGYFWGSNLQSLEAKKKALYAMCMFKKQTSSNLFDCVFKRWLGKRGEHLNYWEDNFTNYEVLDTLLIAFSVDEIRAFGIDALNACFDLDSMDDVLMTLALHYGGRLKRLQDALWFLHS